MKEGRGFTGDMGADSISVILNQAAVKRMRFKQAINQVITWHDQPQHVHVVGVVNDALMDSPFSPAEPTIFAYMPYWGNIISYRLAPTVNTHDAIAKLSAIFSKFDPSTPYTYKFVDEVYASKFNMETLIGTLWGSLRSSRS